MSDWERLYQKNKEIAKRFAGQVAEKAKDGFEQVKKGSVKNPLEIRNLRIREIKLEETILNNRERLKAYKRLELVNEYVSKWDAEIHRSYFRNGGIQFYVESLMKQIARIDPDRDSVDDMIVSCYNSAIDDMRKLLAQLIRNCDAWEENISVAGEVYSDDKVLKKSLGYVDCAEEIKDLYYNETISVDVAKEVERLGEILDRNETALYSYLSNCETHLKERPRMKADLLEDLKRLIGTEELDRFEEVGDWTPETYAAAITAYGKKVKDELLDKYSLSEIGRE